MKSIIKLKPVHITCYCTYMLMQISKYESIYVSSLYFRCFHHIRVVYSNANCKSNCNYSRTGLGKQVMASWQHFIDAILNATFPFIYFVLQKIYSISTYNTVWPLTCCLPSEVKAKITLQTLSVKYEPNENQIKRDAVGVATR